MSEEAKKTTSLPAMGAKAELTRTITDADVVRFAEISGDYNPVHLDEQYAARSIFGARVAHGFLAAAFISAAIGTKLPGPGSIYLGQTLKFVAPVYLGDTVTVSLEVIGVRAEKSILTLRTDCKNQQGKLVITGEATVKYVPENQTS